MATTRRTEATELGPRNDRAQHVYENELGFRRVGVRVNSRRNQLGEPQTSVNCETDRAARRRTVPASGGDLERRPGAAAPDSGRPPHLLQMLELRQVLPVCLEHLVDHLLRLFHAEHRRGERVEEDRVEHLPGIA